MYINTADVSKDRPREESPEVDDQQNRGTTSNRGGSSQAFGGGLPRTFFSFLFH